MKRLSSLLTLATALSAGLTVPCRASHEDIGASAQGLGMGDAMTAAAEGITALQYNPAGLAMMRTPEFGMGFKRTFVIGAGRTDLTQMSWAAGSPVDLWPLRGTLGVLWEYTPRGTLSLDRTMGITYATRGFREYDSGTLDLGVSLKALSRSGRAEGASTNKAGVDVGGTFRMSNNRVIGLSFLNLNGPRTDVGPVSDRAPVIFKLGYSQLVRGFTVAMDFSKREPSFGFQSNQSVASGVEYWWHTMRNGSFAGRTGLDLGDPGRFWGVGAGWRVYGAEVDYAIQVPLDSGSRWGNSVSLIYRFGPWNPEQEYERMLSSEMEYRRNLAKALDAAEVKQWKLSEELRQLREDMNTLRQELASKTAQEAQAQDRLRAFEERGRKARETFDEIERQKRALAAKSKESLYREDWAKYLKLKTDGAPDLVLQERVKQILLDYKNTGVDLSDANQELLRLQRNAPAQ